MDDGVYTIIATMPNNTAWEEFVQSVVTIGITGSDNEVQISNFRIETIISYSTIYVY